MGIKVIIQDKELCPGRRKPAIGSVRKVGLRKYIILFIRTPTQHLGSRQVSTTRVLTDKQIRSLCKLILVVITNRLIAYFLVDLIAGWVGKVCEKIGQFKTARKHFP